MSSADKAAMEITVGVILMTSFISFMILMAIVGFVVQTTVIGNQTKAPKTLKRQQSQLLSEEQDRDMLLRKTPFARLLICFSPPRNLLRLTQPIQIYDQRPNLSKHQARIASNFKVFSGIRGWSSLYYIFGATYLFCWYAIIENPQDIITMKQSFYFALIPGALFTAPVFLFTSGFLQTFNLMMTLDDPQPGESEVDQKPRPRKLNLKNFYTNKLLRLAPYNLFIVGFFTILEPYIGNGPLWKNMDYVIEPCKQYWWTTALFINNFYPSNYDDKCMGWNWFIPVYLQLTLILPILLSLYIKMKPLLSSMVFTIIFVGFLAINVAIIASKDIGVIPFFNSKLEKNMYRADFDFYSEVFMKPWYHFNSYFIGVCFCLVLMEE